MKKLCVYEVKVDPASNATVLDQLVPVKKHCDAKFVAPTMVLVSKNVPFDVAWAEADQAGNDVPMTGQSQLTSISPGSLGEFDQGWFVSARYAKDTAQDFTVTATGATGRDLNFKFKKCGSCDTLAPGLPVSPPRAPGLNGRVIIQPPPKSLFLDLDITSVFVGVGIGLAIAALWIWARRAVSARAPLES